MSEQLVTWSDPTAAALFGVAGGSTAVWALLTGRIGMQDLHIFIVWLMGAALILTIARLINLRRGHYASPSSRFDMPTHPQPRRGGGQSRGPSEVEKKQRRRARNQAYSKKYQRVFTHRYIGSRHHTSLG